MKETAVFVAVKREDGTWDLLDRLSSVDTWCQVGLGIHMDVLPHNATMRTAADQSWVILCFGGWDHDAIDLVLRSPGQTHSAHDREIDAALKSWRERPGGSRARLGNAAVEPKPAQKKEEPPPACWFCEKPSVSAGTFPACLPHVLVAAYHAERMHTGGGVDCPESRAETLRFVRALDTIAAEERSAVGGFRTQSDSARAEPAIAPSLPSEEIPAAGMTPHYEWP